MASRKSTTQAVEFIAPIEVAAVAKPAPVRVKPSAAPKATTKPKATTSADHKVCRVCGVDKPLVEYRAKATRPDGVDTICRECAQAWDRRLAAKRDAAAPKATSVKAKPDAKAKARRHAATSRGTVKAAPKATTPSEQL